MQVLKDLPDNYYHLIVTSPPYWRERKYGGEEKNIGKNQSYEEYLEDIREIIKECKRILVPGGFLAWQSSIIYDHGTRYPIPWDTARITTELGMTFLEDIIWMKHLGATRHVRAGPWRRMKRKPTTYRATCITEYVIVHQKPGEREDLPTEWDHWEDCPKEIMGNIWQINPTHVKWHSAIYPEKLVENIIRLYTFEGDNILDPFLGSGTTMKVAKFFGRNCDGIEINPEFVEKSLDRISWGQQKIQGRNTYEVI